MKKRHALSVFITGIAFCLMTGFTIRLSHGAAPVWQENNQIRELFKSENVSGTFVLYDAGADIYTGCNRTRAETRYVPASTFKIPNSLIGLATGAVKNVDDILPYRGDPHPFNPAWVKDMGLRQAIILSNVPIYQELARRIGPERMKDFVAKLDYGSKDIGISVDSFWLNGPLTISAIEQACFLAKLACGRLPLDPAIQQSVREIILLDRGTEWKIYGKTGWQNAPGPGVGWWVGWIEKNGRVYAFALNMDIREASDADKRIRLGKACLKTLGLMTPE